MTDNDHGIAGTAHDLVYGERAKTYGHPKIDFSIIANIWTGLMKDKLKEGEELDAYRVAVLMTGLKLARLVQSPGHTDSRIDTIGYMLTMERLDEVEDAGTTQSHNLDCTFHPTVADLKDLNNAADEASLKDAVPYEFPKLRNLINSDAYRQFAAEHEIDKLLGRETAEHSMELDAKFDNSVDGPLTSPHHPVNIVLRGYLPVNEIQWYEGDRIEMLNDPSIVWLYSQHSDQWYLVTSYSPATHQLYNYQSEPDDFSTIRTEHSPLLVTSGTYKGLLILKDGVGYVA
jgi:hypothetical protein